MEVAYLFEKDAASPDAQSGRPASILREFKRAGYNVHPCFPLPVTTGLVERIEQRLARMAKKRYFKGRSKRQLRQMAHQAAAKLRHVRCDFIFSPGTLPLAYLKTDKPIVFSSDCTFRSMVDYYPEFSQLGGLQLRDFEQAEGAALRKSSLMIYASDWAARSAMTHYGVSPDRVAAIPSGANLGAENRRSEVDAFIRSRPADHLDLLFVGKDWVRKGGALCLETVRLLNQSGLRATLHVVGCRPIIPAELQPHVQIHGLLKPSVPEQRAQLEVLFQRAHFLFVPSRAEAYGMAFCEANAFGSPCITTATGGIPTIVREGINGIALPLSAGPTEYAEAIRHLARPERYVALAHRSFAEFEERLNWGSWMREFSRRIDAALVSNTLHAV
jgi:glycosyltransferase involved in cell wall biosynthesis